MKCDRQLCARFLAEFTGTAMLMTLGCMGCIASEIYYRDLLEVGMNFGFVVMTCIQIFGFISGAHMNPAVTLANLLLGYIPWDIACIYFVLQHTGALLGYSILALIVTSDLLYNGNGLCTTFPHSAMTDLQAVGMEYMLTATLILFCCSVWDKRNADLSGDSIPLRFGLLIGMLCLTGGYFTNTSLNFARTLAPAIYNGHYKELWIYFVAQILAATTTPLAWLFLYTGDGFAKFSKSAEKEENN